MFEDRSAFEAELNRDIFLELPKPAEDTYSADGIVLHPELDPAYGRSDGAASADGGDNIWTQLFGPGFENIFSDQDQEPSSTGTPQPANDDSQKASVDATSNQAVDEQASRQEDTATFHDSIDEQVSRTDNTTTSPSVLQSSSQPMDVVDATAGSGIPAPVHSTPTNDNLPSSMYPQVGYPHCQPVPNNDPAMTIPSAANTSAPNIPTGLHAGTGNSVGDLQHGAFNHMQTQYIHHPLSGLQFPVGPSYPPMYHQQNSHGHPGTPSMEPQMPSAMNVPSKRPWDECQSAAPNPPFVQGPFQSTVHPQSSTTQADRPIRPLPQRQLPLSDPIAWYNANMYVRSVLDNGPSVALLSSPPSGLFPPPPAVPQASISTAAIHYTNGGVPTPAAAYSAPQQSSSMVGPSGSQAHGQVANPSPPPQWWQPYPGPSYNGYVGSPGGSDHSSAPFAFTPNPSFVQADAPIPPVPMQHGYPQHQSPYPYPSPSDHPPYPLMGMSSPSSRVSTPSTTHSSASDASQKGCTWTKPCFWGGCGDVIAHATRGLVTFHLTSKHGVPTTGRDRFQCQFPNCTSKLRPNSVSRHVYTVHIRLCVKCPGPDCTRRYSRDDALMRHMRQRHPALAASMESEMPRRKRRKTSKK